jgi:hypothetical protein
MVTFARGRLCYAMKEYVPALCCAGLDAMMWVQMTESPEIITDYVSVCPVKRGENGF